MTALSRLQTDIRRARKSIPEVCLIEADPGQWVECGEALAGMSLEVNPQSDGERTCPFMEGRRMIKQGPARHRLNFDCLEGFLEVAKVRNFSRAASILYRTQP